MEKQPHTPRHFYWLFLHRVEAVVVRTKSEHSGWNNGNPGGLLRLTLNMTFHGIHSTLETVLTEL